MAAIETDLIGNLLRNDRLPLLDIGARLALIEVAGCAALKPNMLDAWQANRTDAVAARSASGRRSADPLSQTADFLS